MTMPPLEDPDYVPQHPPVNGQIPDVVAKWSPASQLRWFDRFAKQLKPQSARVWDRFYCSTVKHRGGCCDSCIEDREYGFDLDDDCCCRVFKEAQP